MRAGGLRLDVGAGRGFPGMRIRHGRPSLAVAARPTQLRCDRRHDSIRLDSLRICHAHGHMPERPCSKRKRMRQAPHGDGLGHLGSGRSVLGSGRSGRMDDGGQYVRHKAG